MLVNEFFCVGSRESGNSAGAKWKFEGGFRNVVAAQRPVWPIFLGLNGNA